MKENDSNRKKNTILSQLNGNSFWEFVNFVLIIIIIIIVIIFCLINHINQCTSITRVQNTLCDDCRPCTIDYSFDENSCVSENKMNGELCGSTDVCFNHSLCEPTCNSGKCIGEEECCLGNCTTTDDCPDLETISLSISKTCDSTYKSCVYEMIETFTDDCLGLIQDIPIRQCLSARYELGLDFIHGKCSYHFACKPLHYGQALPDAIQVINISLYY